MRVGVALKEERLRLTELVRLRLLLPAEPVPAGARTDCLFARAGEAVALDRSLRLGTASTPRVLGEGCVMVPAAVVARRRPVRGEAVDATGLELAEGVVGLGLSTIGEASCKSKLSTLSCQLHRGQTHGGRGARAVRLLTDGVDRLVSLENGSVLLLVAMLRLTWPGSCTSERCEC